MNERVRIQNAALMRTLLNTLSDGVYATDLQGNLTFMNAAAELVLGWNEQELIGRPAHDAVTSPQDGNHFVTPRMPHLKVLAGGEASEGVCELNCREGRVVPVEYRARPIMLDGRMNGALVSFQDISARQQAEDDLRNAYTRIQETVAELEFQKNALDQHAIVSITDACGKIIYANDKFVAVSQYTREQLLGEDHRILNSGYHSREFFKQMWMTIAAGNIWHGEVRNRRRDGSFYWVESTIVPFMDEQGQPLRYIAIRTDITDRKNNEIVARLARERLDLALNGSSLALWDFEWWLIVSI